MSLGIIWFWASQMLVHSKAQYAHQTLDFCLKKVCEQTISGRHLPYTRILQILHSREYLNAVHILPKGGPNAGKRRKRQAAAGSTTSAAAATEVVAHSLNNPLLMSIPFIVLSAMFLSSLRKRNNPETISTTYEIEPAYPEIVHHGEPPPPPLVPPHLPQPGQPGGGYKPDHLIHGKILSLVPYGLIPVAVFPAHFHYYGDVSHHFPSECVIFSDAKPIDFHHYVRRSYTRKRKKSGRTKRDHLPYFYPPKQLFGFRCLVTVIDKKSCKSAKECQRIRDYEAVYGHGYFFKDFEGSLKPIFTFFFTHFPQDAYLCKALISGITELVCLLYDW